MDDLKRHQHASLADDEVDFAIPDHWLAELEKMRVGRVRRFSESNWTLFVVSFLFVVVLWQAIIWLFSVPPYVLPSPPQIAVAIWETRGMLWQHSIVTLKEILVGFGIAVLLGFPVAMGIAFSKVIDRLVYPLLVAGQAVPKVAIAPIMVLWFGFGFRSNVAVAASIAIFPVVVNCALGLKNIDPDMVRLGRSMGASTLRLLLKVRIPNALPNVFAGLKLGITFAVVGAIVGQFIAGSEGLGYLIQLATGQLRTVLAFASIVVLSFLGILLFYAVELLERIFVRWHVSHEVAATG